MNKSFEEYMQEVHAESYHGTSDKMIDDFEIWICGLDADSWLMYGKHYGNRIKGDVIQKINKISLDLLN